MSLSGFVRKVYTFPIILYKKYISPCMPPRCRYYPSCSAYALEAVKKHGIIKGTVLGAWRIIRCNPFSRGGVDHVPDKFDLFYYKRDNKHEN